MLRKPIAIALIASLAVSGAQAALLTNIQGMVTVNHGYGYEPAGAGGRVGPGDRVHAGEGSADIVYENGSTVNVGAGQTVIVLSTAPACTVGSQTPDTLTYAAGGMWLQVALPLQSRFPKATAPMASPLEPRKAKAPRLLALKIIPPAFQTAAECSFICPAPFLLQLW